MTYLLAVHVPIAGMSLLPALLRWPLALLPVHILFLGLIIDPACSIVFEAEPPEKDAMRRPPRDSQESLFSRRALALAFLQGAGILAAAFVTFFFALAAGREDQARALAFLALVAGNLGLISVNRSSSASGLASLRIPTLRSGPSWEGRSARVCPRGPLSESSLSLLVPGPCPDRYRPRRGHRRHTLVLPDQRRWPAVGSPCGPHRSNSDARRGEPLAIMV